MGLSTDKALELIGLELQAHRIGLDFLDKKTRDKINAISNILNNDRVLSSSNFQKKHARITGYPSRGVMPSGMVVDLSLSADGKRYEHAIKQASKRFAPLNWFPPAVIRKPQPLYGARHYDFVGKRSWGGTDVFTRGQAPAYNIVPYGYDESQASLAGQWAQAAIQWRHNVDIVGKRVPYIQTKYTGSTALVPSGIYSQVSMHSDEYYAMKERLKNQKKLRYAHYQNGKYTDDNQYAFGADTGVHDDFAYLREIEEEQRLRASRRSIAVRRMQIDAYRKFPWVKTLVDAGIIQKKEIPKIAKSLNRMSKAPIIGSMIKHPAAAGIGLATALMSLVGKIMSMESSANKTVTQWESMAAIYGKPSDRFDEVMKKAGINEYSDRVKAWGDLSMKYGNPDAILQTLGSIVAMGPKGIGRGTVANILGLSEAVATGAMTAAGGYKPSEAAERNSILAEIQRTAKEGFKSGSSLRTKSRALTLKMLGWAGEAELESHGLSWLDLLSGPFMFNAPSPIGSPDTRFSEWDKARRAAESAEEYERNKSSTRQSSNSEAASAGNQVSFNINSVNVDANNYQEFIQSIASEAGMRYNIDVMEWADSRRVKG